MLQAIYVRGGPFDFWGGGGVEENVPEQSIYFFQGRKQFFILPAAKKKLFPIQSCSTRMRSMVYHRHPSTMFDVWS